jgi:hypothetical protein
LAKSCGFIGQFLTNKSTSAGAALFADVESRPFDAFGFIVSRYDVEWIVKKNEKKIY